MTGRTFTDEFKREAVSLLAGSRSAIAEPALVHDPQRQRPGTALGPSPWDGRVLRHHAGNRQDRQQQVVRAALDLLAP